MKTEKLTESQQNQLDEYRNEIFQYATSTKTDRDKAAEAALELTKDSLKNPEIHWVASPEEGKKLYNSLRDALYNSLRDSLYNSLRDSLQDSLYNSLRDSLQDFLRDSLWDSLWDSLRCSLSDSLWDSLCDSMCDSMCDSSWIAFHRFSEKIGIMEYEEKHSNMLECYEKLLQSCFAIYVLPGHIILVEKPKKTEIEDGKLVNIEW